MQAHTALAIASVMVSIFGLVAIQLIREPKDKRKAKPHFSGFFLTGIISALMVGNLGEQASKLYEIELIAVTAIHQLLFVIGLAIRFSKLNVERVCYFIAVCYGLLYWLGQSTLILTICFSILISLINITLLVTRQPKPNFADVCLAITILLILFLNLFGMAVIPKDKLSFLDITADDIIFHLVFAPAFICGQSIFLLASYMIDNNQDLMQIAQKDSLTNMLNRRAFFERMKDYFAHLKDSHGCGSIIIADIDYFKKVNDTYGHDAGDQGLLHFESIIRESIRDTDIAARYGGEEFVVFLPGADLDTAMQVAERMRSRCENSWFDYKGKKVSFTSSFGVTECLFSALPDASVAMADKALYEAKKMGRNQVRYRQL